MTEHMASYAHAVKGPSMARGAEQGAACRKLFVDATNEGLVLFVTHGRKLLAGPLACSVQRHADMRSMYDMEKSWRPEGSPNHARAGFWERVTLRRWEALTCCNDAMLLAVQEGHGKVPTNGECPGTGAEEGDVDAVVATG